jgi:hypothetical protein
LTQHRKPGVYIVIHGQVFPVDRAQKDRDLGTFVAKSQAGGGSA